ncbi:MAG: hypothetical protein IPM39_20880 [Chloroflexi bacterium]|nr:hypothetical protein [Chloroflexota bacterium]
MTDFLPTGMAAPLFTLTAVYTETPITPGKYRGRPVLLTFSDYQTAHTIQDLVKTVRRRYDDPQQLMILNVIDFRGVPRLMRGPSQRIMNTIYEQAARQIPKEYNPDDHLIILPDWEGKVCQAYRVPDIRRHLALALLNGDGQIYSTYYGPDSGATAVRQTTALIEAQQ